MTGAASFYGLGWNVEFGRHGVSWGHAGAFSTGARTLVTLYPDAGLGIVVLTNAFPTGVPEGIADSFFDLVFDGSVVAGLGRGAGTRSTPACSGPAIAAAHATYAAPPDPATPALPDAAYVGTYANAYAGEAVVAAEAGGAGPAARPGGQDGLPAHALRPRHLPLRRGRRDAGHALVGRASRSDPTARRRRDPRR